MNKELLRMLPKVDELLSLKKVNDLCEKESRNLVVESIRDSIDFYRKGILQGKIQKSFTDEEVLKKASEILKRKNMPHLKRVVNGAGIVIHTNLGRSLLCEDAVEGILNVAKHYNNLEYNLEKGSRGSRYSHIEELIKEITGAEGALVVNNNAAAVMLALNTLCEDKEAIVSRGQLVEIGGSFRIPEVMRFSKANLVEVGTTNRTHLYDYENNITENTGVLLKVHTSNFKIYGFTEEVPLEELVKLGSEKGIPVMEDIGSGVLVDLSKYGFPYEPTVQESIKKGVDVVTFSGDKMLGGPQAGVIAGKKEIIERMKKNQITRALRVDKFTLAALEGTLRHYRDEIDAIKKIPTLNMMLLSEEELKKRAQRLKRKLSPLKENFKFNVGEISSMVGGGSMPTAEMKSYAIKIKSDKISEKDIEEGLRAYEIPIITRVYNGEVLIDLRTIQEDDYEIILNGLKEVGDKI
ncbi:L-seryl-tRNA(Sec) selenium transferase [Clostridium fallax]|uniref:L-seryl-tRNA(Sec) selenium transferase n=1 Tax=Clostridium fallax TaxID=1533 RepID=A0A1M4V9D2_9CLOT|nr:L-seryl-tRNA(Sec) selenium transferase [Clostridium fallax]SHE65606.1 L-seryl-tRNA(Sec) selenium transferase [Clostridium fallax]SQB05829.1 L-seryl-tRNA(Sec) selenium transferase [Clostridium fallax]